MIAIQIKNIRNFMTNLLAGDTFDLFPVSEVAVTTFASFSVDGTFRPEYYGDDAPEGTSSRGSHVLWRDIRLFCYSLIRGKHLPLSFKIVFSLSGEQVVSVLSGCDADVRPEDVQGMFINCRYQNDTLTLTTGTAMRTFTQDRSADRALDLWLPAFLAGTDLE